jgi:hypothetical protein
VALDEVRQAGEHDPPHHALLQLAAAAEAVPRMPQPGARPVALLVRRDRAPDLHARARRRPVDEGRAIGFEQRHERGPRRLHGPPCPRPDAHALAEHGHAMEVLEREVATAIDDDHRPTISDRMTTKPDRYPSWPRCPATT